jgi:DNA-binding LacI/PurR family transcriptional regulator
MSVTIKDIAKKCGVTVGTVSKVLNNREGVSEAVRLKILKTAERLGYFPYIKARESGIFRKTGKYICEIYGHATPYLVQKISLGISEILNNSQYYEIKFMLSDPLEKNYKDKINLLFDHIIRDKDVIALIIALSDIDEKIINELVKNKIYIVLINSKSEYASSVLVDDFKSAYKATEYLIKTGCKNIGLIIPEDGLTKVWQNRKEGFKKALLDNKLEYTPDLIEYENTFEIEQTKLAVSHLLEKNKKIDGIIFSSDWQAYAGIKFLKENNIKIPDQISIIGFDDLDFNCFIEPALTTIRQPMEKMGKIASQLVLKMIKENKFIKKQIVLDTELIIRETTKKI